jgi:hypothetical protein
MSTHSDTLFVGPAILKWFDHNLQSFRLGLLHRLLLREHIKMNRLPASTAAGRHHDADHKQDSCAHSYERMSHDALLGKWPPETA